MGNDHSNYKSDRETLTYSYYCYYCSGYTSNKHNSIYCAHCRSTYCDYQGHACNGKYITNIIDKENTIKRIKEYAQLDEMEIARNELQQNYDEVNKKFICVYCLCNMAKLLTYEDHIIHNTCKKCNVKHPKCSSCISESDVAKLNEKQEKIIYYYKTNGNPNNRNKYLHNLINTNLKITERQCHNNKKFKTEMIYNCFAFLFILAIMALIVYDVGFSNKSYLLLLLIYLIKIFIISIFTFLWIFIGLLVEFLMDCFFIISFGSITANHSIWWNTDMLVETILTIWFL